MCVVAFFTAIGGGSRQQLNFAPKSAKRGGVPNGRVPFSKGPCCLLIARKHSGSKWIC